MVRSWVVGCSVGTIGASLPQPPPPSLLWVVNVCWCSIRQSHHLWYMIVNVCHNHHCHRCHVCYHGNCHVWCVCVRSSSFVMDGVCLCHVSPPKPLSALVVRVCRCHRHWRVRVTVVNINTNVTIGACFVVVVIVTGTVKVNTVGGFIVTIIATTRGISQTRITHST